MPSQDMFNTPQEEAARLADELRQVKAVMKEMSRKLTQIETRAKRAFPAAFPKATSRKRGGARTAAVGPPTMTRDQVMAIYDEAVRIAKGGDPGAAREHIEAVGLGDLNLLRTELGASLGRKKPSKPVLLEAVLGRLNESVMLTKHTNRQELIERSEMGEGENDAPKEGQP